MHDRRRWRVAMAERWGQSMKTSEDVDETACTSATRMKSAERYSEEPSIEDSGTSAFKLDATRSQWSLAIVVCWCAPSAVGQATISAPLSMMVTASAQLFESGEVQLISRQSSWRLLNVGSHHSCPWVGLIHGLGRIFSNSTGLGRVGSNVKFQKY